MKNHLHSAVTHFFMKLKSQRIPSASCSRLPTMGPSPCVALTMPCSHGYCLPPQSFPYMQYLPRSSLGLKVLTPSSSLSSSASCFHTTPSPPFSALSHVAFLKSQESSLSSPTPHPPAVLKDQHQGHHLPRPPLT